MVLVKTNGYALTYGQLVHAIVGVNQIRLEYPYLAMGCKIFNEVYGNLEQQGCIALGFRQV